MRGGGLLRWLALAAVADWLIARTLTRAAIFIPKPSPVLVLYEALTLAGQLATTLASLLGLGMLGWMAWREWQTGRQPDTFSMGITARSILGVGLSLILLSQVGFSLMFLLVAPTDWGMVANLGLGVVAVAIIVARSRQNALLLPALALLLGRLYQLLPAWYTAWGWPGPPPLTETLFNLGELLVVASAGSLWYAYGRGASRREMFMAAGPALAFTGLYLANPALTGTLAVWSTGLTLYLPWPLYALSLWLAGVAAAAALRRKEPAGWAILLLAAGGYAPQLSTQAFLGLIALWLLAGGVKREGERVCLVRESFLEVPS
jgi:hypothetical protein